MLGQGIAKLIVLFYFISFCIVCSLPFVYGGKCYRHYTVVIYFRRLMRGLSIGLGIGEIEVRIYLCSYNALLLIPILIFIVEQIYNGTCIACIN